MLQLESVSVSYGFVQVVYDVSLNIGAGEIVSVLGANGAGKSTLLKAISDLLPCKGGRIISDGHDVTNIPAYKRVNMGIIQVPEGRHIFAPPASMRIFCWALTANIGNFREGRWQSYLTLFSISFLS